MNPAKQLSTSLGAIREELEHIEQQFDTRYADVDIRNSKSERLDLKLRDLLDKQKQIVHINIGGKIFQCNLNMILSSEYDNIITQKCKEYMLRNDIHNLKNECIDRNPKHFKYILDIFRKKEDAKKNYVTNFYDDKPFIEMFVNQNKINVAVFLDDLQFYFPGKGSEKLFEEFKFFYDLDDGSKKYLHGRNMNINHLVTRFEVGHTFPNEMLKPYQASKIEEIMSLTNVMKAVFCDYDSHIIFCFSEPVKVKMIELRPFWGDLEYWYPGDGAGETVYYSKDKVTWDILTLIPDIYGCDIEMTHVLEFPETELQYVKIETKTYAMSVSYIKFS